MSKAKISEFRPQVKNANKHTPRGLGQLSTIIGTDGWISAITVCNDGETIDGTARLETAYEIFGDEVEPIIVRSRGDRPIIHIREDIESADDPRAIKLSVAANRIAQIDLDWDVDVLKEWDEEIDLSSMFFDGEIESMLGGEQLPDDEQKEEDQDDVDKLLDNVGKVESRVKLGEIWQLGRHRIACGDSTVEANVRALLGDRFNDVGMVWADPPFNTKIQQGRTASNWGVIEGDNLTDSEFNDFVKKLFSVTALFDTPLYICCHWKSYPVFFNNNNKIKALIIWVKNNFGLGNGYRPQHEFICFYGQFDSTTESNVWEISKDSSSEYKHPMQKPLALLERAFNNSSQPNDVIFDPFLGSAPSIIAAQKMDGDRTVYGFELSPDYCEVILQRFTAFTGEIPELVGYL